MAAIVRPVIAPASKSIYRDMTTREIVEKLLLLKLCGSEAFVKRAHKLHTASATLLGERLTSFLMHHVMVKHFVPGEDYPALKAAGEKMLKNNIKVMFVPPMEDVAERFSDAMMENCRDNKRKYLEYQQCLVQLGKDLNSQNIMQFKLSAVMPSIAMNALSASCEKKRIPLVESGGLIGEFYRNGNEKILDLLETDSAKRAMKTGLQLSKKIFEKSAENHVPLLIDAELLSAHTAMYAVYIGAATIPVKNNLYSTYQCYMKDMHSKLEETMAACESLGVRFGAKIVRGAYLQMERDIAAANGKPDPTWESAAATSKCYDDAVEIMMNQIAKSKSDGPILCVATHNAESVEKAKAKMDALGIARYDPRVSFGQIYGMCDHISWPLGQEGYNVFKSTPYGPPDSWVPYLSRRAAENHSAVMTARNEAPFYWRELRRRFGLRERAPVPS